MNFGTSLTTTLTHGTSANTVRNKTICCWFKADALAAPQILVAEDWVGGGGPFYCRLGLNTSGEVSFALRTQSTNWNWFYSTTTSISTGEWAHACLRIGAYRTAEDVSVFLNGGGKYSISNTYLNGSAPNRTTIGGTGFTNSFDGLIGWVYTYTAKLTDAEIATLGTGAHPSMVRPDALKLFWPLGWLDGEHSNDVKSGTTVTEVGTPTWSDDSPTGLIYPSQQIIGMPKGVSGPIYNQRQILIRNQRLILK